MKEKCICESRKCLRAALVLRSGQLCMVVDTEGDVWINRTTTDLVSGDAACAVDDDFNNTNCRVYRSPRKKLFEIEGKGVGVIHHRAED